MSHDPRATISDQVPAALDLLTEELEKAINQLNLTGTEEQKARRYPAAQSFLHFVQKIEAFAEQVEALKAEWTDLAQIATDEPQPEVRQVLQKTFHGRVEQGSTTSKPILGDKILEVLASTAAGSLPAKEVVDKIGDLLRADLTPMDLQRRTTGGKPVIWRNNAQWARNTLVKQGLLAQSRYGIWEINAAGRAHLAKTTALHLNA